MDLVPALQPLSHDAVPGLDPLTEFGQARRAAGSARPPPTCRARSGPRQHAHGVVRPERCVEATSGARAGCRVGAPPPDRPQRRQDRKVEAYRGGFSANHKPQASGDESESPSPTPQPGPKFLQKEHLRPSLPRSYGKDWPFWPEFHSLDGYAGRRRADRWCICRSHLTGNGSISPGNVIPSGCRPSRIASTMAGASSVGRSRRET